jgi:hypothetical protein
MGAELQDGIIQIETERHLPSLCQLQKRNKKQAQPIEREYLSTYCRYTHRQIFGKMVVVVVEDICRDD